MCIRLMLTSIFLGELSIKVLDLFTVAKSYWLCVAGDQLVLLVALEAHHLYHFGPVGELWLEKLGMFVRFHWQNVRNNDVDNASFGQCCSTHAVKFFD